MKLFEEFIDDVDRDDIVQVRDSESKEIPLTQFSQTDLDFYLIISMPGIEDYWWTRVPDIMKNTVIKKVEQLLKATPEITEYTRPILVTTDPKLNGKDPFIKLSSEEDFQNTIGDYSLHLAFSHQFKTPWRALSFISRLMDITCFEETHKHILCLIPIETLGQKGLSAVPYSKFVKDAMKSNKKINQKFFIERQKYENMLTDLMGSEQRERISDFLSSL